MRKDYYLKVIILGVIPVLLLITSLMLGTTGYLSLAELWTQVEKLIQTNAVGSEPIATILWKVRLPRIVLTFLVGASLAVSGAILQAIFRNPIVDPFTLGISSGAAFGAALTMLFPLLSVNLSAFLFGVCAVVLTYAVSFAGARTSIVSMVLSGVIVSGAFTAMLTLLQYLSDPYKLQAIIQWTMGNLHTASWSKVQVAVGPIIVGLAIAILLRWKLNVLALGDEEAMAVGVNPTYLKLIFIAVTTMITSASVAAVGVISLFGLIVPHMTRMLLGPDNSVGVWANISIGGSFLLVIDDFSRVVMPFEIPVGVFTMLIGTPIFIILMRKSLTRWNS